MGRPSLSQLSGENVLCEHFKFRNQRLTRLPTSSNYTALPIPPRFPPSPPRRLVVCPSSLGSSGRCHPSQISERPRVANWPAPPRHPNLGYALLLDRARAAAVLRVPFRTARRQSTQMQKPRRRLSMQKGLRSRDVVASAVAAAADRHGERVIICVVLAVLPLLAAATAATTSASRHAQRASF